MFSGRPGSSALNPAEFLTLPALYPPFGICEDNVAAYAHYAVPGQNIVVLTPEKPEKPGSARGYERNKPAIAAVIFRVAYVSQPKAGIYVYVLVG